MHSLLATAITFNMSYLVTFASLSPSTVVCTKSSKRLLIRKNYRTSSLNPTVSATLQQQTHGHALIVQRIREVKLHYTSTPSTSNSSFQHYAQILFFRSNICLFATYSDIQINHNYFSGPWTDTTSVGYLYTALLICVKHGYELTTQPLRVNSYTY
jgi:hypothetical protein